MWPGSQMSARFDRFELQPISCVNIFWFWDFYIAAEGRGLCQTFCCTNRRRALSFQMLFACVTLSLSLRCDQTPSCCWRFVSALLTCSVRQLLARDVGTTWRLQRSRAALNYISVAVWSSTVQSDFCPSAVPKVNYFLFVYESKSNYWHGVMRHHCGNQQHWGSTVLELEIWMVWEVFLIPRSKHTSNVWNKSKC